MDYLAGNVQLVIAIFEYYMGCIYDDFECYISFENSKIVRGSI